MSSLVLLIALNRSQPYDELTVSNRNLRFTAKRLLPCTLLILFLLFSLVCVTAFGQNTPAPESGVDQAGKSVTRILIIVFLIIATAASGWYFGGKAQRIPFLIGIAAFSAACGLGVGFCSAETFAGVVPALAAAYGGALVCAVSASGRDSARAIKKATESVNLLAYGSAASGIPLMLGAYSGNSIHYLDFWYPDPRRLLVASLIILILLAVSLLIARNAKSLPLPLAGGAFGAFIGLVAGLSQDPVVGYVAPAALALFAGAAAYAFTSSPEDRRTTGGILLTFGVLLITGLIMGAIVRQGTDWSGAPLAAFAFSTLLLVSLGFGAAVGVSRGDAVSGLGFSAIGAGVGLSIGMSQTQVMHLVGPALLAVLAGLTFYVFISDPNERRTSVRLLLAFGMVVLLGSFVGYSLRQGDLRDQLARVDEALTACEDNGVEPLTVPGVDVEIRDLVDTATACLESAIYLEGSQNVSVVVIRTGAGFEGTLTVEERVNRLTLYDGAPPESGVVAFPGERLRIRWPVASGRNALQVQAWERVSCINDEWVIEGDGERLDLAQAEVLGDEYVFEYPQ